MIKRFYILLLAIVASVGMSWASVTWISDQYGNHEEKGYNAGTPFTKDGVTVTMSDNAFFIVSYWGDASLQCVKGTFDPTAGNYVFSNSLGENFVKIIIAAGYTSDWEWFPKGDGWVLSGDEYNGYTLTWTGNASTVTLMNNELHSVNQSIEGDIVFMFESDSEEPAPAKLPGAFTINADGDKIVFSKGNLQATTTDLGANWTWDFAPNQWSLIGNAVANNAINGNKKVSANGTVDLFGWSTAATYYGINNSWKNDDYTGDFVDWGALMGTEWRTLSRAEFYYIVYSRTEAYKKRGQATVNGVPGYVLLPDAWTLPSGLSFTNSIENYTTNQYDGADWTAMESAGAVFLPAAGVREGTDIYQVNLYGWYWASTPNETDGGKAYYLWFDKSSQGVTEYNRWKSKSVRLVTEAPIPPYEAAIKLINAIGTVELTAECKAKIDAARAAFIALSDGDKDLVTNYSTLQQAEAAFDNVMDIWLSGDCDAILWSDTTLTVRKHAGEGNGAMADYTDYYGDNTAPWFNSHWYNPQPGDIVIKSVTIEEGVTHIGENAFGWMSELKTVTIPSSMTSIGEDAFYWSKAVDDIYLTVADPSNLTWVLPYSADNQFKPEKATLCHVPADLLTAYQENFGTLNMTFVGDLDPITPLTPEQQQALDAAKGLINAIPSPVVYTPACKDAIDAARAAYDALTPDMLKQLVSNYKTLTDAEATYANLKDVVEVEAKINAIPTTIELKLATRDSIESARAAYDALTADQQALVSNYDVLTAAEAALAGLNPGGGMPAGALSGKFTINADGDQIAFAKGNLQATTTDLGEHWTWGFAANQWDLIGNAVANTAITGSGTVSANGTVDLFGWSTPTTYYGIHNSKNSDYYSSEFREWGENITGATWKTPSPNDWIYIISNRADAAQKQGQATVNGVNGYIFLPDEWELPTGLSFTAKPNNWTANVYDGDDWTAMENAGAVFLPKSPWRSENTVAPLTAGYYWSSDYNSYSQAMAYSFQEDASIKGTGINRFAGIPVRLVTAGGASPSPLDSAEAVKNLIEAIPAEITLDAACVNAIQAARDAYNALAEATKGALDVATVDKLNKAITDYTALIQAGADAVKDKIAAIPQPVTLKLATRDSIESARAAYDALTADQKALVTNYDVLEAAEATWAKLINAAPAGALSGKYTINAGGDVIYFAHGNLQYTRENLDADWSTGTFRLAENQYDRIELVKTYPDAYCTDNYGDKTAVGLFGWGTWGEGKTPNLTSSDRTLYTWSTDFSGTLEGTNTWRTLTKDEWVYLLTNHNMTYATVHGVNGLLVAPDGKDIDGKSMADWVEINDETWTTMQNDGYLFLPACGQRSQLSGAPITTGGQGEEVLYYSSTEYNDTYAYNIWYKPGQDPAVDDHSNKRQAFGIRLVSAGVNPLDQVQVVKGLIDAIPAEITLDAACVNAIQAASAGYDALDNDAKAILDPADVQKLTDAEQALKDLNQAEADKVVANINNIPTPVELKLATRDSIESARAAYDALTADQKALVPDAEYQKLLDAEAALAEKNPGVPPATPLDSAQAVKDLIGAIREPLDPTEACGAEIAAALNAYDALSDAAKGALDDADVQKLNDAATQYAALVAIAAIEAIPAEITYDPMTKSYIEIAKAKYDALSDASKALVDDEVVAKLTNAEQAWADLVAKVEHNVSYIGKDGELKHETVALLHIPDPAPDFNGYEFVRWDVKAGDFLEEGLRVKAVYTPIITTNPVAYDTLEYNGLAQELVKAGVAKEGNIEYSLYPEEPESWSANLPTATNAAAYVVYYKLVREGHEDYMAGNITVVIAKTQVSYTAPVAYDTLVYNYNMQTLIEAGITNDGIFEYTLNPLLPDSWSTDLPQGMNAGTYNVNFRVIGDMNHFDSIVESPIVVTIAKRDIVVTAPAAYDTLVYNAQAQTLAIDGTADFNTMEYTLTPNDDNSWFTTMPKALNAGSYEIYYRVPGDANHNDFEPQNITATIAQAPLTITAIDSTIVYGDAVPEFIATYSGWQGQDDETVVSNLAFSCAYQQGSYIGTYAINPNSATAHNYAITFVDGTLTVNKAHVYVSGAEAQIAKFADGHANAVVLEQGILNGIKLNDPIAHVTTAAFSSADVAENLTITLFYELTGDAALLNNYYLEPTSDIFTNEGVIIEPFIPDNEEKPEDKEATVNEGIEIYAYGYCDGSGYSLRYHLESGNPDQYKIDFADSRFTDVDWTNLVITGKDGTIDIDIPVDMPTGDYTMTVYFRDSRFVWLESRQFNVTFHVNLPETYVRPLFDNVIALVDTCHCLTDIQWYWRANSTELWQPIEGANGYYYHVDGKLTGEYFVSAKMNGEPTYTCGQTDMETLYGDDNKAQAPVVRAYPNPVINTTTVTIENSDEWNHNIRIVNLMGAEVMSDTFEGNETSVEMGNYPQGNYMISVDGIVVKVMKK